MRVAIGVVVVVIIAILTWFLLLSESEPPTKPTNQTSVQVPGSTADLAKPKSTMQPDAPPTNRDLPMDDEGVITPPRAPESSTQSPPEEERGSEKTTISLPEAEQMLLDFIDEEIDRESILGLLIQQQIIERFVLLIDNLPGKTLPHKLLPVESPGGLFLTSEDENGYFIAEKNHDRYYNYVRLIEMIDAESAVTLYQHLYSHFQHAYEQLGYPGKSFDKRLKYVIDHLLGTPQKYDPVYLERPKVLYTFADPSLESRSAGQKLLLRSGGANSKNVKRVLKRFKRYLDKEDF